MRGHWVHLDEAWQQLRAHHQYPLAVEQLLGEAVAACVLLAATLKFRGALTFQLQGNGAVSLLVAQCTDDFRVRAVARYDEEGLNALPGDAAAGDAFRALTGSESRITVTVEAEEKSMRYQGVVPLTGDSLAESLEAYFDTSEQLPTRVVLGADARCAGGMLIQKLPGAQAQETGEADIWDEAGAGVRAVTAQMLLGTALEPTLKSVFPEQALRVFEGAPVRFECRCNPERIAGVLRALGSEEIRDLLREQGSVTVTCEFCHRPYSFDSIDIEALFADSAGPDGPALVH